METIFIHWIGADTLFYVVESMLEEILQVVLLAIIIFFGCITIKFVFSDFLEKHFVINFIVTAIIPLLAIGFELLSLFF